MYFTYLVIMATVEFEPQSHIEKEVSKPLFTTEIVELVIANARMENVEFFIKSTFHPQTELLWEGIPNGSYEASVISKDQSIKFYSVHRSIKPNVISSLLVELLGYQTL